MCCHGRSGSVATRPKPRARFNSKGYTQVRYIPFFVPWLESFAVPDEVQRARLKRWQDDPLILCVARLSEEKNIALLLQAFGCVTSASQRGRLVVVGSGPLREELERLASGLGIAQRVSWPGAVETTALPWLLPRGKRVRPVFEF